MPKNYLNPLAPPTEPGITFYRVFWGTNPAIGLKTSRSIEAIATLDGASNTGLVFEANEGTTWTKPDDFEYGKKKPLPKFALFNKAGFLVCFADGSVRLIPHSTPEQTIRYIIEADDGINVPLP